MNKNQKKDHHFPFLFFSLLLLLMSACSSADNPTSQTALASRKPGILHSGNGCAQWTPEASTWGYVGSNQPVGDNPTAVSWGGTRNDVFYVDGSELRLHHEWTDQSQVGGYLGDEIWGGRVGAALQPVSATTWGPGRLDVFLVGTDHQLSHYWQDGSPSVGTEPVGGYFDFSETPAAVSQGVGYLDVFLIRPDGQLDHWWQNTNLQANGSRDLSWHVQVIGGHFQLQSPLSVVSRGMGLIDVFLVGTDHQLYDVQQSNQATSFRFISLGGSYGYEAYPASVHWGDQRADVFIINEAGQLLHNWTEDGVHFGGEYISSGWKPTIHPSATSWNAGRLDIFLARADRHLAHVWQDKRAATGATWNQSFAPCGQIDYVSATNGGVIKGISNMDVYADFPPNLNSSLASLVQGHYSE